LRKKREASIKRGFSVYNEGTKNNFKEEIREGEGKLICWRRGNVIVYFKGSHREQRKKDYLSEKKGGRGFGLFLGFKGRGG